MLKSFKRAKVIGLIDNRTIKVQFGRKVWLGKGLYKVLRTRYKNLLVHVDEKVKDTPMVGDMVRIASIPRVSKNKSNLYVEKC